MVSGVLSESIRKGYQETPIVSYKATKKKKKKKKEATTGFTLD
jgi:hypothetical protein